MHLFGDRRFLPYAHRSLTLLVALAPPTWHYLSLQAPSQTFVNFFSPTLSAITIYFAVAQAVFAQCRASLPYLSGRHFPFLEPTCWHDICKHQAEPHPQHSPFCGTRDLRSCSTAPRWPPPSTAVCCFSTYLTRHSLASTCYRSQHHRGLKASRTCRLACTSSSQRATVPYQYATEHGSMCHLAQARRKSL